MGNQNLNDGQIVACQDGRINVVKIFEWLWEAQCYVVEIMLVEDYQGDKQVVEKLNGMSVSFATNIMTMMIHLNGVFMRNCIT